MEHAASVQMGVIHERVQAVWWLRGQVKALAEATAQARASAGKAFIAMKSPINPPIIDLLSETFQVEDRFLGSKLCSGLPVVGVADISPFFEPYRMEATLSIKDFLSSTSSRREALKRKIFGESEKAPRDILMAVVEKTAAEVSAGTMGPRRAMEDLIDIHGQYANFCQRFGIKQGLDSSGNIKYRCIDNHATSGVNEAATRTQKILMSNIASIMLLIVRYESVLRERGLLGPQWSLVGATEDLKAAYRQCPLSDSMISLCLVMFYNPSTKALDCHESYGQPFGAGHAVPNFYRIAQWCATVGRRLLKLPVDHFFDDFWIVEPKCLAPSGVWAFRSLMKSCGFGLDPGKSQIPASVWNALGVAFDMQTLRAQSFSQPDPVWEGRQDRLAAYKT